LRTDGAAIGSTAEVFGSTVVSVDGTVYAFAAPMINTTPPVAFGNVRVGDGTGQTLSITNNAANDIYSEKLNAIVNGTTGGVTATGFFTGLAAQSTDNSSISVAINTTTAGNKDGTATIDFVSDGTGINNLGLTPLPSQDVSVTGQVFRLAQAGAHTPEPVTLTDVHVGDTSQQVLSMTNTATSDGFSEKLNATIGGATSNATATGSFNLLAAGATNNSSLAAGAKTGIATITSESDGTGTSDISGNVALADQTVNVSGNVYRLAQASAHTPEPVVLSNVHVGDTSQQALSLSNTATVDSFSEKLNATIGGATGNATASGAFTGLAAGATDSSNLVVGINTSTAGAKSGTASIGLVSDGAGINSLGRRMCP